MTPRSGYRGLAGLPLTRQIATFGFVSVTTTVLDFALFNALILPDVLPPVAANTLSYSAGIIASYLLNKRLTFPGGGRERRSHEFALFLLINLSGLAVNNVAVGLAARADASAVVLNLVKLIAGAATWVLKFVTFKRWVYPMRPAAPEFSEGRPD